MHATDALPHDDGVGYQHTASPLHTIHITHVSRSSIPLPLPHHCTVFFCVHTAYTRNIHGLKLL